MDWAEWSLSKLNALVEWPIHKVKAHIRITISIFILAVIGATIYFTTDLFEQLLALASGQAASLVVSRKNLCFCACLKSLALQME